MLPRLDARAAPSYDRGQIDGPLKVEGAGDGPASPALTFSELVSWWVEVRGLRYAETTRCDSAGVLRRAEHCLPSAPSTEDLERYFASLRARGLMLGTVNKAIRIVRALYRAAVAGGLLFRDPSFCIREVPERDRRPRVLPQPRETFPALVACCSDARSRFLLLVQRYQGLRISEALGLEWSDVDLVTSRLHVYQARNSSRFEPRPLKGRGQIGWLPLHPLVAAAYQDVLRERYSATRTARRYIVPFSKRKIDELMARFRASVPGAFPPGTAWHALRHTYASELLEAGIGIDVICRLLRHSSLQATEVYLSRLRGRAVVQAYELVLVDGREREELRAVSRFVRAIPPAPMGGEAPKYVSRSDCGASRVQAIESIGPQSATTSTPRTGHLDSLPRSPETAATWASSEGEGTEPERTARAGARRAGSPASRSEASHRSPTAVGAAPSSSWSSTLALRFPPWPVTAPPSRPASQPRMSPGRRRRPLRRSP